MYPPPILGEENGRKLSVKSIKNHQTIFFIFRDGILFFFITGMVFYCSLSPPQKKKKKRKRRVWSALHLENLYLKLDQDGCTFLATPSYSLQNHACIRENTHRHSSTIHNGPINDQNKKLPAHFSMQRTPLPCMHRRKVSQIAHIQNMK